MKRLAAAALALLLGGCVYSLEPFYLEEALVAPPAADGKWHVLEDGKPDTHVTWLFEGNRVTALGSRGQWRSFSVRYFKAGGVLFADSFPEDVPGEPSSAEAYWQIHFLPFHMLSRVRMQEGRLIFKPLTAEAFNRAEKQAPSIRGAKRGEYTTIVTGATPKDWARFLEKHASNDDVFPAKNEIVFVRAK